MRSSVALLMLLSLPARAEDTTTDLNAERDALIDKIVRGVDRPAQSRRFGALWRTRQARLAASEQAAAEAKAYRASLERSPEGLARTRCALAVDPAHPPQTQENLMPADWGHVAAVRTVTRAQANPMAPPEVKVYDVVGEAATYVVPARAAERGWPELDAKVGDWVLVCKAKEPLGLLIAGRPLIAGKSKWNPVHMPPSSFDWVIAKQNWYYPASTFVLTHVMVQRDLGDGRLSIETPAYGSWILEVPPSLPRRALLKPGRGAWVIAGKARLDAALGKLVLTAEDVEDRYLP